MKKETKIKIKAGDKIYFKDNIERQVIVVERIKRLDHENYDWLGFIDVETGQKNSIPEYYVFSYKLQNKGNWIDVYWRGGRGYGGWLSTEKI